MINYVVKTEDYEYFIMTEYNYIPIGTEFIYYGRRCKVIANNGKI